MRVLFAIKGLHRAAGGAERVICDLCTFLAEQRDYKVTLLTFDSPGTTPFYALSPQVELLQLGLGDPSTSTSLVLLFRRMAALRKVVLAQRPDVVVGFMHSMFIPMAFALVGSGIPLVASEHIVKDHYRTRRAEFALFMAAVPFVNRITVLSNSVAQHYPVWIRRKMVPITNPISSVFRQNEFYGGGVDCHRILSVGRFSEQKDHITLLRAFALIAAKFPEWTLRILGDGALRPALENEVIRLQLGDRVSMPGVVTDIAREMAEASFFALASRYESFGLVFAEAMASGKASLAFADCPGANEIIDDGRTGLLVSGICREEALAEGLCSLILNPEERARMGELAQKRVFEQFSIELVGSKWEEVMHSVCH